MVKSLTILISEPWSLHQNSWPRVSSLKFHTSPHFTLLTKTRVVPKSLMSSSDWTKRMVKMSYNSSSSTLKITRHPAVIISCKETVKQLRLVGAPKDLSRAPTCLLVCRLVGFLIKLSRPTNYRYELILMRSSN